MDTPFVETLLVLPEMPASRTPAAVWPAMRAPAMPNR